MRTMGLNKNTLQPKWEPWDSKHNLIKTKWGKQKLLIAALSPLITFIFRQSSCLFQSTSSYLYIFFRQKVLFHSIAHIQSIFIQFLFCFLFLSSYLLEPPRGTPWLLWKYTTMENEERPSPEARHHFKAFKWEWDRDRQINYILSRNLNILLWRKAFYSACLI
jgi:hypothetical protein